MVRERRLPCAACLWVLVWSGPSGAFGDNVTFRTVVVAGEPVAGSRGVFFAGFFRPSINNTGQTAFRASLTGPGVTPGFGGHGVWSEGSGTLAPVALLGGPAAGTAEGVYFDKFYDQLVVINDTGQTAFTAGVAGPGIDHSNDTGLWSERSGSIRSIAQEGRPAPGAPPAVAYGPFGAPIGPVNIVFNTAGQTAYWGHLTGPDVIPGVNSTALWSERTGSVGMVTRYGSQPPGLPAGVRFSSLSRPVMNESGAIAFSGSTWGHAVGFGAGVWSDASGALAPVVLTGEAAPGIGEDATFAHVRPPTMNRSGHIAFLGRIDGNGVIPGVNDHGIWSNRSGSLAPVVHEGDAAPGTPAGVRFASFERHEFAHAVVMNGAAETAFIASVAGPRIDASNDEGIWAERAGLLSLIARDGARAPGTPHEVAFGGFERPVINANGQVAFVGHLTGPGITDENDTGLWATDPLGNLELVLRAGDLFAVYPGDERTIQWFHFGQTSDGENGRPMNFNERGQLPIDIAFADGSTGIFVATVPEPAMFLLVCLAGMLMTTARRHT